MVVNLSEIERMLTTGMPLSLHVFKTLDGDWLALLTVTARHAWLVEDELTRSRTRNQAMRQYFETNNPLFPVSRGRCHTPQEALQALNQLLEKIPAAKARAWTMSVSAAYAFLSQHHNDTNDGWLNAALRRGTVRTVVA
jgi:hypothetical protein